MADTLSELQQFLRTDSVSSFFWDRAFKNCDDKTYAQVDEVVDASLQKYGNIPAVKSSESKVGLIVDYFPSFLLRLSSEVSKNLELEPIARNLYLAGLATQIAKSELDPNSFDLFFKSCPQELKLTDLNRKLGDKHDAPFHFPALVNQDFELLDKNNIILTSSKKLHVLIEFNYYFEATSRYYLRYFREFLSAAPSDTIAQHVEFIFGKLFISLRLQEMMYWQRFGGGEKLKEQLLFIIHKDQPKQQHPILRRAIFNTLNLYNPSVQTGRDFIKVDDSNPQFIKVFNELGALSNLRLTIYLKNLLSFKGPGFLAFILDNLGQRNSEKLPSFITYLQSNNAPALNKLRELVITFISSAKNRAGGSEKKRSPQGKVLLTAATQSRMRALKNLQASRDVKKMTANDVADYLQERLKKIYERSKIKGALTQDGIPEYLNKLADVTKELLMSDDVTQEAIQEVAESASTLLQEIAEEGSLSSEKFEGALKNIHETTQKLNTDDKEERIALVEQIGETLAEASQEKSATNENFKEFVQQKIIPIGLEKKAPYISVADFFRFPLGEGREIPEEKIFNFHIRYLGLAENIEMIEPPKVEHINEILDKFEKNRYRKYFNIFPNDKFDETILMAVYSMW